MPAADVSAAGGRRSGASMLKAVTAALIRAQGECRNGFRKSLALPATLLLYLSWLTLPHPAAAEKHLVPDSTSIPLSAKKVVTPILPAQARVLQQLWSEWGRNRRLTGWGPPWLCNATGVECNAQGGVSSLSLSGLTFTPPLQLTGLALPESISGLSDLTLLDLSSNYLSGSVSSVIGALKGLKRLDVSSNDLTGSLPASIGAMLSLQFLSLSYNSLTGSLPSAMGHLVNLDWLDLSSNALSGTLPSSLGGMTSVKSLLLHKNGIAGSLPSHIGALSEINAIDFSNNKLTGRIPLSFGGLSSLQKLSLQYNGLTGSLPSTIGGMHSLTELDISHNGLSGRLPPTIGDMHSIQSLDLCNNLLAGSLPSTVGSMTSLQEIDLSANRLAGSLPSSMGHMTGLLSLNLHSNQLSGQLPSTLGAMRSLTVIDLHSNAFRGSLPDSIGNMSSLFRADFSGNGFSGSLPASFGGLLSLNYLDLRSSKLTGSLPASIGGLTSLKALNLRGHRLTGSLPSEIGSMSSLQVLDLSFTNLTGSLPHTISRLTSLETLQLRSNSLAGSLPSALGRLPGLLLVDISGNKLSGSLPSSIGMMSSLQELILSDNSLSGSLPSTIGDMSILSYLELGSNAISGSIPQAIGSLQFLSHLELGSNSLAGDPLALISELWGLTYLDLGQNPRLEPNASSLSGLAVLSRLLHLGLAIPQLTAPIDPFLLPLKRLTFLSLEGANVSGSLPASAFDASSSLQSLNLHGTAIQGELPSAMALLSSLSKLEAPGRMPCPALPCRSPAVARNQAFCAIRCTSFCATCPASRGLQNLAGRMGLFGEWTNGSVEATAAVFALDEKGEVRGLTLSLPQDWKGASWSRLASSVRFDKLPAATLRTLIVSVPNRGPATLSSTLSCLSALRTLDVSQTPNLQVPPALSSLTALTALDLSNAQLPNDGFPSTLSSLRSLRLSGVTTSDQGWRPFSAISRLSSLTRLDMSGNGFQGPVPAPLSLLTQLANLDLSYNQWTGSMPRWLTRLTSLTFLNMGKNNNASISIPTDLSTLPLSFLIVERPYVCLEHTGRSPCPRRKVNPSSPFCTRYCRKSSVCSASCYPTPRNQPPPAPPPPSPPPLLPPPAASGIDSSVIAAAACTAGALVLLAAVALGLLLVRAQRNLKDGVEKRGVRRLRAKEVDTMTGSFSRFLGGDGTSHLYAGKIQDRQWVKVRVSDVKAGGKGTDLDAAKLAFREEVWVLSGFHHRNVQELYGFCLGPQEFYLVFEAPQRGSLWSLLREQPQCLTWSRRLRVALTAALGLDYLHSQLHPPVVHKDVKSRSVLVTPEFEAKLGVAGLAALELGDEGSHGYADPSRHGHESPSTKSDVYAFGVLLLELATGLPPLSAGTHILSRVLGMTDSDEELQRAIPSELRGELQTPDQRCLRLASGSVCGGSARMNPDGSPMLTLQAFRCLLELGIACCLLRPMARPSMARVVSTIEELLHGKSSPLASMARDSHVPFPGIEYPQCLPSEVPTVTMTDSGNPGGAP